MEQTGQSIGKTNDDKQPKDKKPAKLPGKGKKNDKATPSKQHGADKLPPTSGCWVCIGSHWLRDYPTVTPEQKDIAPKQMQEVREKG
ncbi:TPA: hypothetical protein N0F65_005223 [Lagenidium giganteum]|uniref:Uncharacterized protein n=1 Tax=Lagenidium giganteum TaxID=4803 RepID=A0AAV2YP07_9STRA|nr:TPA: hypothetical protein N0F65_005223 [Lagenidium giganteum]